MLPLTSPQSESLRVVGIMLQHLVANCYAKKPCKAIFCVGLHATRDTHGGDADDVQLAVAYMYDLGLTKESAIKYSERICTEMGLAEQHRVGSNELTHIRLDCTQVSPTKK